MELGLYLKSNRISVIEFAKRIGRSRKQVHAYVARTNVPRDDAMTAIVSETKGAVTPNDFHGITESALK
jgi:hypothetical protein